jgi:DNA sulfur modification protein DndB
MTASPPTKPASHAPVPPRLEAPFEYVFPAIRGVQAGREYYTSMCPLRLLPKIFLFDEEELVPELRAQRVLNKARLPEIARYVLDNPSSYVFSAITVSIDGDARFQPIGVQEKHSGMLGALHVGMSSRFIINDGQHRRAAIEVALRERPELANESIAVVFFIDAGLEKCQQMFADLNRYAVRPSKSVGVLYDHRDERALIARLVVMKSGVFRDVVEMERSTLSARSRRLFTLSAIYGATSALLHQIPLDGRNERVQLAISYWDSVAARLPEWREVGERRVSAAEIRRDFIHSHGIVLHALGRVGNTLLRQSRDPKSWDASLRRLDRMEWSRSNRKLWEGRALIGGRVSKAETNVVLTTNAIKKTLGLSLAPEEQRVEDAFLRGD